MDRDDLQSPSHFDSYYFSNLNLMMLIVAAVVYVELS